MIEQLTIRTMAKAVYSTANIGHYGLAFKHYSHFTSPIRRYPDVIVHRLLQHYLDGGNAVNQKEVEDQCKHSSKMEILATEAERASIKYKQVEFIEKHLGESFEGTISGIIDRGIFVELVHSKCEGMVGFDTLDEAFDVKDGRLSAVGLKSGKTYKMGDSVRVVIKSADMQRRQIDMTFEEEE